MGELLESRAQGQSVLKPRAQSRTHRSAIQAALAAERYEGRLQGLAVRQDAPGPLGRMRLQYPKTALQRPPPNPKRDSGRLSGRALRRAAKAQQRSKGSHTRPRGESSWISL